MLSEVLKRLKGAKILQHEPMGGHTSFRIGGRADALLLADSGDQALYALSCCREFNVPALIMGLGTNLLVRDGGIRGLVIKLADDFSAFRFEGTALIAQAGAHLSRLARESVGHGLMGLEFAGGIPGTLGGAVAMNAGAYGGELKQVLYSVKAIDENLCPVEIIAEDGDMGYRSSRFQAPWYTVLEAVLHLKPDDGGAAERHKDYLARRKEKQPLDMPSAGSTFLRPPGGYAGSLIEKAGLKGFSVGAAAVSEKHAGFIVNLGGATAKDVLCLIDEIKQRVYDDSGVLLTPELKIVGED